MPKSNIGNLAEVNVALKLVEWAVGFTASDCA